MPKNLAARRERDAGDHPCDLPVPLRGEPIPPVGLLGVSFDTSFTGGVHVAEPGLRGAFTLFGGQPQESQGLRVVLLDPDADAVHQAEAELPATVPLLGG